GQFLERSLALEIVLDCQHGRALLRVKGLDPGREDQLRLGQDILHRDRRLDVTARWPIWQQQASTDQDHSDPHEASHYFSPMHQGSGSGPTKTPGRTSRAAVPGRPFGNSGQDTRFYPGWKAMAEPGEELVIPSPRRGKCSPGRQ